MHAVGLAELASRGSLPPWHHQILSWGARTLGGELHLGVQLTSLVFLNTREK